MNFKIFDILYPIKDYDNHVLIAYSNKIKIIYDEHKNIEETLKFIQFFNKIEEIIYIKSHLCKHCMVDVYLVNYDFYFWSKIHKTNILKFNNWFMIGYKYVLSEQAEIKLLNNYLKDEIVFESLDYSFINFNEKTAILHKYSNNILIKYDKTVEIEFCKQDLLFVFLLLEEKVSAMMWYHDIESDDLLYKLEIDDTNTIYWNKINAHDIEFYHILCNINFKKIKLELEHRRNLSLWNTGHLITHYQAKNRYNDDELEYILKNLNIPY